MAAPSAIMRSPDIVRPVSQTMPELPTGLFAPARTGKVQVRGGFAAAWRWTEEWHALDYTDGDVQALLAFLDHYWNSMGSFTIQHLAAPGLAAQRNGASAATTAAVKGAAQTGTSLIVDGLTPTTTAAVAAGDWFVLGGRGYRAVSDANSDGTGTATLDIVPAIGNAYADDAVITMQNGSLTARLVDYQRPRGGPSKFFAGMRCTFLEAL